MGEIVSIHRLFQSKVLLFEREAQILTARPLDLSLAGTGISVESTTPQGGTFGGGPPNSAVVVSFLGVQYNFSTGEFDWNPVVSASKGPKAGIQAIVGFQVGINPTKLKQLGREMQACSGRQGS